MLELIRRQEGESKRRLAAARGLIQMALDERARADHFRLKGVKQALQRKSRN